MPAADRPDDGDDPDTEVGAVPPYEEAPSSTGVVVDDDGDEQDPN
jgi:hypothetical protein